jgi:hypothetical protein
VGGDCPAPLFDRPSRAGRGRCGPSGGLAAGDRPAVPRQSLVDRPLASKAPRHAPGTWEPKPHGGGPPPALGPWDQPRLAEVRDAPPDATWEQLQQPGGFQCSQRTVWRGLRQRRLTFKEKSLHACERDRPEVPQKRRAFRRQVRRIEPQRLVFVDERGVTTARTATHAWAPRGERAVGSTPGAWQTVPVITALRLQGVAAPLAFPGATDPGSFQTSVDKVGVPALRPGEVVVGDNLKPPRAAGVVQAIAAAGARLLPWPPESPDSTPIESMDSQVQQGLRRVGARTEEAREDALGEALRRVTRQDILGWFQNVGLYPTHASTALARLSEREMIRCAGLVAGGSGLCVRRGRTLQ